MKKILLTVFTVCFLLLLVFDVSAISGNNIRVNNKSKMANNSISSENNISKEINPENNDSDKLEISEQEELILKGLDSNPFAIFCILLAFLSLVLFIPLLILLIVFVILNRRQKRVINEYERRISTGFGIRSNNFTHCQDIQPVSSEENGKPEAAEDE